jgi:hypothetical protein
MREVHNRVELGETWLASRASQLSERDIRGNNTIPECAMDKGSRPRL